MSKELPQPQPSEEVDLGQLFKLIGNAFDRFFKFIASIFIGVYKLVLLLLIHFYKRVVWYVGAIIIGVIVGFIIDKKADKLYGANMFIETNFNSARQVYENLKQFHQMAYVDNDSVQLAQRLNISVSEAAKLKGFYIEPDLDENKMAEMYSGFYLRLDSISRLNMTYEMYKKSLTSYNFNIHRIGVASTDKAIYKKIEKNFTEQIADNSYLNELVEVNQLNLNKKDEVLLKQVQKTDSLVDEYLKIRINESNKELVPGSGTNLYMGDAESSNLIVDESKIVDKRLEFEAQRRQVNQAKVEQQSVINVLAGFPDSGYDISEWYYKIKFVLPIILFSITALVFAFLGLGRYLEKKVKTNKMNLLVTGGAGFIGSNFTPHYLKLHQSVHIVNIDKLTYAGELSNLQDVTNSKHYTFIQGDICDRNLIENLFRKYNFQGVINFAAESHVDNSISNPDKFIKTNIFGTFNLLDVAKNNWMKAPNTTKENFKNARFHHISTDEVYGTLGELGFFTEQTPYAPNSPYSASKASSDFIVRSYFHTYGMNVVTTNCSNNYGPKQHDEKLIPTIIRKALFGEEIPIYGNGENVRDWLYVEDHCKGIDLVFNKGISGETYNIGGKNERNNLYIANTICDILDDILPQKKSYKDQISFVKDRPGHDFRYAIDASKIERELGWKAVENFETGIRKTIDWYIKKYKL